MYNPTTHTFRSPSKPHPTEVTRVNSKEKLVGSNGNLNASDRNDLLRTIGEFFNGLSSGKIMSTEEQIRASKTQITASERREIVQAAYKDETGRAWAELGDAIGTELYETANREGFMRRILMRADVVMSSIPRIPFSFKSSVGFEASSPAQIQPIYVRNKYLLPPEFYVTSHIWVEEREIYQTTGDILEEKLLEGQEQIMVKEDQVLINLANASQGIANTPFQIEGGLTPQNLGLMRQSMLQWNLPTDTLLFASDVWTDITTNTSFGTFYDPVSQFEVVQNGVIGRILGMTLVSDAYRVPELKVLAPGQLYLFTRPEYLGAYTERGPVVANEVNASAAGHGVPARGWHLYEIISVTLPNGRGVVTATRTV